MNRRRFTLLGLSGIASTALVACGNEIGEEESINPTKIADVPGAPNPTLADMATPGGEAPEGEETPAGEGEGGGAIEVEALDTLRFDPEEITASPGDTITLTNAGVIQHDFAIDEFGGVLIGPLNGGESGEWEVPDEPGTYTFYCSIPGHRQGGMEGTLTIAEAGEAPAGEEEQPSPEAEEDTAEEPTEEEGAPPAGEGGNAIEVDALDTLRFDPEEITASPGDTITLTNAGVIQHDFAIDEFGGVLIGPLNGGESGEWEVPDEPGTYTFYCSIPGHRQGGMEGTLTIG